MLDIDFTALRQGMLQYLPVGMTIGLILLVELCMVLGTWVVSPEAVGLRASPAPALTDVTNTAALGHLIYTRYVYFFQAAGLILLVAMIGAIVLTLRHKPNVRRQSIAAQVARNPATAVEIRKVKPGQGI